MPALPAMAASSPEIVVSKPKALPALNYTDKNGKKAAVKPAEAKLTALHFWATWCVPCVEELPQVDKVLRDYQAQGLNIVALSLDGQANLKKVQSFYKDNNIDMLTPAIDADMSLFQAVQVRGLPTTIFVDKEGREIARSEGVMDWQSPANLKFITSHLK